MKIAFTGGGTMGSVSPLLGLIDYLLSEENYLPHDFVWFGTYAGPEREVVDYYDIKYVPINSGKLRRYFSLANLAAPGQTFHGYIQSYNKLQKFKPDVVISTGSFVSVPVIYAAKCLGIKTIIHQLDIKPGLANKLTARIASSITVSWPELINAFSNKTAIWTGTPIRKVISSPPKSGLHHQLHINDEIPLLLIMGGGTGAMQINNLVKKSLNNLVDRYQIVHLTGKTKNIDVELPICKKERYQQFEFLNEDLGYLLNRADAIVSRAGIGSISEILAIKKPTLIIPIADSHQEINADYFQKHNVIKRVNAKKLTADSFQKSIDNLILDKQWQVGLAERISKITKPNPGNLMYEEIKRIANV